MVISLPRFLQPLFGVVLCVCLASCDPVYPFPIHNGFSVPITARLIYVDGDRTSASLEAGGVFLFMHPKGDVERIVILSGDEVLFNLDKNTLAGMQESARNMRPLAWSIRADGIKLLGESELNSLRSKK